MPVGAELAWDCVRIQTERGGRIGRETTEHLRAYVCKIYVFTPEFDGPLHEGTELRGAVPVGGIEGTGILWMGQVDGCVWCGGMGVIDPRNGKREEQA